MRRIFASLALVGAAYALIAASALAREPRVTRQLSKAECRALAGGCGDCEETTPRIPCRTGACPFGVAACTPTAAICMDYTNDRTCQYDTFDLYDCLRIGDHFCDGTDTIASPASCSLSWCVGTGTILPGPCGSRVKDCEY